MGRIARPDVRKRFNVVLPVWLIEALDKRVSDFGSRNMVIEKVLERFHNAEIKLEDKDAPK